MKRFYWLDTGVFFINLSILNDVGRRCGIFTYKNANIWTGTFELKCESVNETKLLFWPSGQGIKLQPASMVGARTYMGLTVLRMCFMQGRFLNAVGEVGSKD